MIKVTIYKTERQEYAGFDMEGHAGYAEAGEDIVCAGVSALVINALNSIERFTDDETSCVSDEDTGSIEFRFDGIQSRVLRMIRQVVFLMKTAELLNFVSKIIHRMTPHYCWIP